MKRCALLFPLVLACCDRPLSAGTVPKPPVATTSAPSTAPAPRKLNDFLTVGMTVDEVKKAHLPRELYVVSQDETTAIYRVDEFYIVNGSYGTGYLTFKNGKLTALRLEEVKGLR